MAIDRPNWEMVLAGFVYAGSLLFALSTYLNPVWGYYGFSFATPGPNELVAGAFLISFVSLAMPVTFAGAVNIVLVPLYVVVFVPTIVISLTVSNDGVGKYGLALAVLSAVFSLACMLTKERGPGNDKMFSRSAEYLVLLVWGGLAAYLVVQYRSIMTFADFTAIYEQRALGAAIRTIDGYAQTYFGLVFCPAILAIGLLRRRASWIGMGLAGFVGAYMISANRTVILLPLVMILLFALLTVKWKFFRNNAVAVLLLAAVVAWAAAHHETEGLANHLATYFVSFAQYPYLA